MTSQDIIYIQSLTNWQEYRECSIGLLLVSIEGIKNKFIAVNIIVIWGLNKFQRFHGGKIILEEDHFWVKLEIMSPSSPISKLAL